jgi:hypothetical protein
MIARSGAEGQLALSGPVKLDPYWLAPLRAQSLRQPQ